MRSAARKSGSASAVSASTTPTSVTPGKSCPFVTICVPTSTSSSRRAKRGEQLRGLVGASRPRRGRAARRARRGSAARTASSTCSVPTPDAERGRRRTPGSARASRSSGRSSGTAGCPRRAWCVSETAQSVQRASSPHASQHDERLVAAAVQEQDRLLPGARASPRARRRAGGEHERRAPGRAPARRTCAGRRAPPRGIGRSSTRVRQLRAAVAPAARVLERLERRRRGAEDAPPRPRACAAHDREVARVVGGPSSCLKRRLVLLVDDDDRRGPAPARRSRSARRRDARLAARGGAATRRGARRPRGRSGARRRRRRSARGTARRAAA